MKQKQLLIKQILEVHRELLSGDSTEELLNNINSLWEHGIEGLKVYSIPELEELLEELNTEDNIIAGGE